MSCGVCFQSVTDCPQGKHFVFATLTNAPGVGSWVSCEGREKFEADYRRLLLGDCGGYLAIFTEGKGFGVGGEDLEADMVGAGSVMFVDSTHHGL